MIEFGEYKTMNGAKATVTYSKKIGDKTVFVGRVEGVDHYVTWNDQGKVWGFKTKDWNIEANT